MQIYTSLQTDNHASIPPLSFFTGWMPFLLPNQQHQYTEGLNTAYMCTQFNYCSFSLPEMSGGPKIYRSNLQASDVKSWDSVLPQDSLQTVFYVLLLVVAVLLITLLLQGHLRLLIFEPFDRPYMNVHAWKSGVVDGDTIVLCMLDVSWWNAVVQREKSYRQVTVKHTSTCTPAVPGTGTPPSLVSPQC